MQNPSTVTSRFVTTFSRSVVVGAVLATYGTADAAPFSDEEVERRMAEGANLSAVCRVELLLTKSLEGEYCVKFLDWIHDGFPSIAPNLRNGTPAAKGHLRDYEANLAVIAARAKALEAGEP
jgi:hypothetical protein